MFNDLLNIMYGEANRAKYGEITFAKGCEYAVVGMLIVFAVLIILMLVLHAMKFFAKEEAPAKTVSASPASAPVVSAEDSDETVAVISAAVAAMSGDDANKRMRVVSIRRQGETNYLWKK